MRVRTVRRVSTVILIALLIYATNRTYPIPMLDSGAVTFLVSAAAVWLVYRAGMQAKA